MSRTTFRNFESWDMADISVPLKRYNLSAFLRWKNAVLPFCLEGSKVKVKTTLVSFG